MCETEAAIFEAVWSLKLDATLHNIGTSNLTTSLASIYVIAGMWFLCAFFSRVKCQVHVSCHRCPSLSWYYCCRSSLYYRLNNSHSIGFPVVYIIFRVSFHKSFYVSLIASSHRNLYASIAHWLHDIHQPYHRYLSAAAIFTFAYM
jgi:hypothetical protein